MSLTEQLFADFLPRRLRTPDRHYDCPFDVAVTTLGVSFAWTEGGVTHRTFLPWHRIDSISLDVERFVAGDPF